MGDKISDYPAKVLIHSDDLLDFSNTEDNGATYNVSQKVKVSELVTYLSANVDNIYNADGNIAANRTLTADTFWTKWIDGDVIVEMVDEITDYAFLVYNSGSAEMGRFGYDQATTSGELSLAKVGGIGSFFEVINESLKMNTDAFVVTSGDQIGVGTATPDGAALIEFVSTTQGVLIPRMTGAQAALIAAVDGLMIYVTNVEDIFTIGFWGYQGGAWAQL